MWSAVRWSFTWPVGRRGFPVRHHGLTNRAKVRGFMGVQVREKDKGSGVYWIFINHHGQRKAKRVGDEKTAIINGPTTCHLQTAQRHTRRSAQRDRVSRPGPASNHGVCDESFRPLYLDWRNQCRGGRAPAQWSAEDPPFFAANRGLNLPMPKNPLSLSRIRAIKDDERGFD